MSSILGLPDFKSFKDANATRASHRRRILHSFPNGGAPLTGILSMMRTEAVDAVEHFWYEKRYVPPRADFRGTNPITSTAPTDGDSDDGTNMSTGNKTVTTDHYIKVDTTERLTQGQIIYLTANGIQFRITAVVRGVADADKKGYIKCRPIRSYTAAADDDDSGEIVVIGTAHGEGATGGNVKQTGFRLPISLMNQTQIWRDAFTFPGTVLKQGLEFDKTGPYKEKAYDTVIDHMVSLEFSTIFGIRTTNVVPSFVSGEDDHTVRTMSGIEEYLNLWDAGSAGLSIDGSTYKPFEKFAQATSDTDDRKRVIDNNAGTVSVDQWNIWAERVGRYHTNKTNEKLVLCGSGALSAFHKMFRKESVLNVQEGEKVYGLDFTTLITPYGRFHFVMHPLMNENPQYRNWAMILDVHSMRFRPLRDRDTKLLKNRQNNGDDRRKDEYLTEGMLELHFPENNMIVKNINDYIPS